MKIGIMDSLKNKENVLEDSIILCIKFQRRTHFTFSFILFLKTYSYKVLFYHNVMKAQLKRSGPYRTTENRLKITNCLKQSK